MTVEYIKAFTTNDMVERRLPLLTVESGEPGPVLWLTSGCHGDEITGISVIHRVLDRLKAEPLRRGTLHILPLLNATGNEVVQRNVPIDDENLNRNYPGDPAGGFTERLANLIFTTITATNPDLVLDLHTTDSRSLAHVILDRFTDEESHPGTTARLQQAANAFGITVVYDFPMEEYKEQKLDRSLSGALLNKKQILSYTVELGPSRLISEQFVDTGVRGVLNILGYLGMAGDVSPWFDPARLKPDTTLRRDRDLRVESTGYIQFLVEQGTPVEAGQPLAYVRNIVGELQETVRAVRAGYVLQLADRALAMPGIPILTMAIPDN